MILKKLTRAALILALMIVIQSLRIFIPLPYFVSIFIIGSMVNACLLIAIELTDWKFALILAITAPVIAYIQQVLPLPIFIIPVAAANMVYVLGYRLFLTRNRVYSVLSASITKFIALYLTISVIVKYVALPEKIAAVLITMLGWPQLVTALAGGILCISIYKRIHSLS